MGDDILISDPAVAKVYLRALELLGVSISLDKSIVAVGRAEFAKSLFLYGKELKPISFSLLKYKWDSVVSDSLSLLSCLSRMKVRLRISDLLCIYPAEEQRKLLAIFLSPRNPYRHVLEGIPTFYPDDGWALEAWLRAGDIRAMDSVKDVHALHMLMLEDPTNLALRGIRTPYFQVAKEGLDTYPGFYLSDQFRSAELRIGPDWEAYDPDSWPDKPRVGPKPRIPA